MEARGRTSPGKRKWRMTWDWACSLTRRTTSMFWLNRETQQCREPTTTLSKSVIPRTHKKWIHCIHLFWVLYCSYFLASIHFFLKTCMCRTWFQWWCCLCPVAGFALWQVFLPCLDISSVGSCLVLLGSTASRCWVRVWERDCNLFFSNHSFFSTFCACCLYLCSALLLAVYGSGGDSRGVGCVFHSLCGRTGVLTWAPQKGKWKRFSFWNNAKAKTSPAPMPMTWSIPWSNCSVCCVAGVQHDTN